LTTLDVVNSFRINNPTTLWPCLPYLDIFLCNRVEGTRLTRENEPALIAAALKRKGSKAIVVKIGANGCYLENDKFSGVISAPIVERVIDTTGAGDAFAAGLIAALLKGGNLECACAAGNQAGARMVSSIGAVSAWFQDD
jgi:2-dehydro-3-deoxygluconokinase